MTKDAIAFLDGETVEEPEVTEEPEQVEAEAEAPPKTEAEPTPKEQPEPKAKEAEAEEQTGEKDPGLTPEPEPQESKSIPVTALLDEREKRQEAQRQYQEEQRKAAELEARLRELQRPKENAPDWFEDPAKAASYQTQQIESQFQQRLMQMSKWQAEREFGGEVVSEAVAYFDRHPQASQQFLSHPSPFHAAVEFYQKQKVAEEIGTDPEAYKQKLRDELRAELEAELTARGTNPKASKPKAPPPSMASAPSTGRETLSPGNTFDEMFPT